MKQELKKLLNDKGLSLIEIVMTTGLVAVGGLIIAQMTTQQNISRKRIEETVEVSAVSNIIISSLINDKACLESIGLGFSTSPGTTISAIKNSAGKKLIESGVTYGGGLVEVTNMEIVDSIYGAVINGESKGSAFLEVVIQKKNKAVQGKSSVARTIKKKFPFDFVSDSGQNLITCSSSLTSAVDSSLPSVCESVGGVLNGSNDCVLKTYIESDQVISDAVSLQNQKDFLDTTLTPQFVDVTGDSINGAFHVAGQLSTNSAICVNGKCQDFSAITCDDGEMLVESNTDGTFTCIDAKEALADLMCTSGMSLSVDTNGQIYCDSGCTPTSWSPSESTVCSGNSFSQTSDCSTTRTSTGTKVPGNWSPSILTECSGVSFPQVSDCQTERTAIGVKTCPGL